MHLNKNTHVFYDVAGSFHFKIANMFNNKDIGRTWPIFFFLFI